MDPVKFWSRAWVLTLVSGVVILLVAIFTPGKCPECPDLTSAQLQIADDQRELAEANTFVRSLAKKKRSVFILRDDITIIDQEKEPKKHVIPKGSEFFIACVEMPDGKVLLVGDVAFIKPDGEQIEFGQGVEVVFPAYANAGAIIP